MKKFNTDILIIGAGPVGLFAVFELGLLDMKCHLIDNLDKIGGQCSELYPDKPIYDIPSRVKISAQELVDDLMNQCKPFNPTFHLNERVQEVSKEKNAWKVVTSKNKTFIAPNIIIAGGVGSFEPRKFLVDGAEKFENNGVLYSIKNK